MIRVTTSITVAFLICTSVLHVQAQKVAEKRDTVIYNKPTVSVVAMRPMSAASDQTFRSADLALLPRTSTQDLLRIVPGLVIAQHAGGGKAEQIFLRGFDADHGTDVNINVDGAPVNMVSHGHGQGYADMHFIIPELVDRVDVVKGPYFAQYGDLTTAGAITLHLADTLSQNVAKMEGGLYGFYRGLALASTSLDATRAYVGAEVLSSRGFFERPQGMQKLNLIGKTYTPIARNTVVTGSAMYFSSSWDASGQIPERAVQEGLITRYGSIDPNEGGNTQRATFQVALETQTTDPLTVKASFTDYRFQLFSNFTFFLNDSVRGDMIEQTDDRQVLTLKAQKSLSSTIGSVGSITLIGANVRYDDVTAALYHDSVRTRISTTRANNVRQLNLGIYGQQTFFFGDLSVVLGLRGDYFSFNVKDITSTVGAPQGSTTTFLFSPKATVTYTVDENAVLFLNSGFGFHSNDARVAVSVPNSTTIPRAFGSEIGARWADQVIAVSAAAWMLDLESEFVWIGDEGTTEQSGRSRRVGVDLEARYQTTSWLTVGGNATFSRGRMRDEQDGQNYIPLAPSVTVTSFAVFTLPWMTAALRLRHVDSRPANEFNTVTAAGYSVFDVNASIPISKKISVSLQCENLFNTQWRESQFDTQSRLKNEATSVSEIHYTPGTPLSIRVGISMQGW
ncbi:MAG: TonB-dependent receptor [Candidatus Kapabacteria bacterium]|nr:TonB-dependent receptor [Candidatus Kapabacteria bacterium]